jgi:hypothetical protein
MALILTSSPQKKINIQGTNMEVPSVYLRIHFNSRIDGISMALNGKTFSNKEMFKIGSPVYVDIVSPMITKNLNPLTQVQSIETAHNLMKSFYEENGYTVSIDMS